MATKVWLDLTMYGIRLFVNLDQVEKVNHTLVVAGPRIDQYRETLSRLGFKHDNRFTNEYWVRSFEGMTPRKIHEEFPRSFMWEMPREMVMPALAAHRNINRKPVSEKKVKTDGPELSNARNLPIDADGSQPVTGAKGAPVLGADDTRNNALSKSGDAEEPGPGEQVGRLPEETAGATVGGSAHPGEGLAQEQSDKPEDGLPAAGELDEPQQASGKGDSDRGTDQEPERARPRAIALSADQQVLIDLAGEIQARVTVDEGIKGIMMSVMDAPSNWLLMNAARPLMGHKTLGSGPFLAGRFYAAIDPTDSMAERYVEENRKLDGHVVFFADKKEVIDLILWEDKYEARYRDEFEGDELYEVLNGRVRDLNKLNFGELTARRLLVQSTVATNQQAPDVSVEQVNEITAETPVIEVDQKAESIALAREVERLFSEGKQEESFALFNTDPTANAIEFEAFVEAMHASAGGVEAALRLSSMQRAELSKAGATRRAIELYAQSTDLGLAFSTDTLASHELAGALKAREQAISDAFVADGWSIGNSVSDAEAGERSWFWEKNGDQIWGMLLKYEWQYSGHVNGAVLPAFTLSDSFSKPVSQWMADVKGVCAEHFEVVDPLVTTAPKNEAGEDAQPVESKQPADDEEETLGIDRIWRGATYENVLSGQQAKNTSRVEAFSALAKAEKDGLGENDWKLREALASFRGWGGIANDVRTDHRVRSKNYTGSSIASHLGIENGTYNRTILANRLESYYTAAPISRAIWGLLEKAGVPSDGRYLEPGCGTGVFYATAPEAVQRHARLVGVECDPIAARIAKVMVPDVTLVEQRLERAVLDRNFDAVIGNVPFGETIISDDRYPKASHIHDYFIVRSLDHLKVGGIMAVITSSGTMDKKDDSVRQQIMAKANLVAAIRLPVEAFGDQGAKVTTDVLILQRRPDGTQPDFDFTKTRTLQVASGDDTHEFSVNDYFLVNPENVLGEFTVESSAFGPKLTVRAPEITELYRGYSVLERIGVALSERGAQVIEPGIAQRDTWTLVESAPASKAAVMQDELPDNAMMLETHSGYVGDMIVMDGKVVEVLDVIDQFDDDGVRTGSKFLASQVDVGEKTQQLLISYITLRDSARELVFAQLKGSDQVLEAAQQQTRAVYETFLATYGPVNAPANIKAYCDDPGAAEVCALELWDDETQTVEGLADALSKRVVSPELEANATNAEDAYFVSIDRKGVPDLEFMEQVSGISQEKLLEELLGTRVFFDPSSGALVRADHYLSGNVWRKLEDAKQAAALNDQYARNVDALVAVQPTRVPFQDITINLGANWIPGDDIRQFAGSLLSANLGEADFKARYSHQGALWSVDVSNGFKRDYETQRSTLYGTGRASFEVLLEKLLNKQKPTHTYKDDEGKTRTDEAATLASRAKQDELNELFYRWVASDPERAERYCTLYNESTNVIRLPVADGSRLTFPGLSPTFGPRSHQADMVAMSMFGYNVMAAHAVGGGKTFEMIAIAMKLKQIGMVNKPMIAVPNHMLGQISREAKHMYPGAKLLMVTADDLRGSRRSRFLAVARNNDWDLVVCTHSMLNNISAPLDVVAKEYDRAIAVLHSKIEEADNSRLERQLSAKIKTLESVRDAVIEQFAKDEQQGRTLTLDKFGVDSLQIDEAHLYKNLDLESSMNVLGVTTAGSKRAFNMWALGQYLEKLHGRPFGLNFFTGTPVANSMCELYVHNKMLRNDLLKELGIHHFDEWASRFGDVVSNLEALPEGGGFRVNERFARFVNLPEMLKLFRSFADVKTKEQMNLPRPKMHSYVVSVEQSEWQQAFMKHLAIRAVAVRQGKVDPSEDNMLSIASAGRKAALDMRLVAPDLPEDASVKLAAVAKNIHMLWERHSDVKATQLVFIDLGTPGKDKEFSTYTELKERLVALGIPESDVAFIHDAKNNDAKEELFAKVRSGEKRVLIGSTEKMGVGTNVQERMCALHNVDCPWRPADIEQRIGRIDRQGNLYFSEVGEYRYTTKDSFDLFMWETNKRKATFIAQALSDPDIAGRDVSEEMDMGYAEVMAVTTGNPKIKEKVEVDDQVVKLDRKERAWFGDRASKLNAEYHLKQDIAIIEQRIAKELVVRDLLPKTPWKNATVKGTITGVQDGDTTWLYATELGNAMLARIATVEARMMLNSQSEAVLNVTVGKIDLMLERKDTGFDKGMWFVYGRSSVNNARLPANTIQQTKNSQILGRSVRAWFDSPKRIDEHRNDMVIKQRGIEALGDLTTLRNATSPYSADLEALKKVKRELDDWFAAQDFNKLDAGNDPFLEMIGDYRMSKRMVPMIDELERVDLDFDDVNPGGQSSMFDDELAAAVSTEDEAVNRGRSVSPSM